MVVGTAREYNDLQGEHGVANISLSLELQVCSTCPTPTESDETSSMTIVPIHTTDALSTTLLTTQQSGTTTDVASTAEESKPNTTHSFTRTTSMIAGIGMYTILMANKITISDNIIVY